jgi:hypothetical protein
MMWGSFGLGVSMMLIAILLSFKNQGGSVAKSTASASVVSLHCKTIARMRKIVLTWCQTFFFTVSPAFATQLILS